MKLRYINFIIALLVYFTCEDFILKLLPVSISLKSYLRFAGEIALFGVFGYFMAMRIMRNRWHKATPIDTYFYLLIGVFIVTTLINQVSPIHAFLSFRTVFRYLTAFYILASISISDRDVRRLIHTIIIIGVVQALLAIVQHFLGREFTAFFIPDETDLEVSGVTKEFRIHTLDEAQNAIGTFGHTVVLAVFQVFTVTLLLTYFYQSSITQRIKDYLLRPKWVVVILGLLLVSVFLTYTRASTLVALLMIGILAIIANQLKKFIYYSVLAGILVTPVVAYILINFSSSDTSNPIADFSEIFSTDYIEGEASNNRLWVMSKVVPVTLTPPTLFGYGGDIEQVRETVFQKSGRELDRILVYGPIKDVYWVTIIFYFGYLGLFLFIFIQYKIYKAADYLFRYSTVPIDSILGLGMKGLVLVMGILSFFVVTWEFRPIAYAFWCLAGITVNRKRQLLAEREGTIST